MCGIFALLNNHSDPAPTGAFTEDFINAEFGKGQRRGPEFSKLERVSTAVDCIFGFHRLAINGLNPESNQPIVIDDITLICNGEIYNYKQLCELAGVTMKTDSDCEIIIHLYKKYGIEQTLQMLDGVFAFILCDNTINVNKLFVARDPYGVRPLFQLRSNQMYGYASDMKCLNEFYNVRTFYNVTPKNMYRSGIHKLDQFEPGTYSVFELSFGRCVPELENRKYHSTGFNSIMNSYVLETEIFQNIQHYFTNAIKKRVLATERPIACLLSGGLDSSLVTALVDEIIKTESGSCVKVGSRGPLETYSIGLAGSEDLKYARIVADYLGTKHTEIIVTEKEFIDAIPEVIYAIESYDTTTVRASIGNYLVSKYIAKHSEAKVIFNGDGSDELCGGYLYMGQAPDAIEFDKECRRLLSEIYRYDVLRSDKSISSNGLEPRTPFLDRSFVQYYLSIHPSIRFHKLKHNPEKYLLRAAFSPPNYLNHEKTPLLPESILWRRKEAFSDGVLNSSSRPLFQIIHDSIESNALLKIEMTRILGSGSGSGSVEITHNIPDTLEKKYYRFLFESFYPGLSHVIPRFWMPRYVEATDASARTLKIYKNLL